MSYTATSLNSQIHPCEPSFLSCYLPNSAAETNTVVNIPWKHCRLVAAYVVVITIIDNTADCEIDLELDAASGTEMMSITVTKNSAVGTQFDATISSDAACRNLGRQDDGRDAVCIELDGSSTGTGAVMLYMYFEPETNQS